MLGRMFTLAEGCSDVEGEPWVAYYCPMCMADLITQGHDVIW